MATYRVIERTKKDGRFNELGRFEDIEESEVQAVINWADGYAYAFASYIHPLYKPAWQSKDGYKWYNNRNGYELRVVEGESDDNIVKIK